jgi:(2Fe-2S) ferredoxin
VEKPKHHIFVCGSYRVTGEAKGVCQRKDSSALLQYVETEVSDRGLGDVMVSGSGCLKLCENGPLMVVYPEGHWYAGLDEEKVDQILDSLEEGRPAEELLFA